MSMHSPMPNAQNDAFMGSYLEALALVERLHRLLLDVIKDEFERVGVLEINAVQALLLFNLKIAFFQSIFVTSTIFLKKKRVEACDHSIDLWRYIAAVRNLFKSIYPCMCNF